MERRPRSSTRCFKAYKMEKNINKRFGITISIILVLISLNFDNFSKIYTLLSTFILICISIIRPSKLNLLRKLWEKISFLLEMTIGRVTLAAFYYFLVTPIGLFLRLTSRDALCLKGKFKNKESYWHDIDQSNDKDQFLQF